jgi:hypothetical protein
MAACLCGRTLRFIRSGLAPKRILIFVALPCCAFADIYATSISTSTFGYSSPLGYAYTGFIQDYPGTTDIDYVDGFTRFPYTFNTVPFTLRLSLPDSPGLSATSAQLTFNSDFTYTSGPSYYAYASSAGPYGCYSGSLFSSGGCYYDYDAATVTLWSSNFVDVTQISTAHNTVNAGIGGSGSVNLLALGMGPDLTGGGTLTVSGYEYISAGVNGVTYNGFDAYTDIYEGYFAQASESATLTISVTPEPSYVAMVGGALLILTLVRYARNPTSIRIPRPPDRRTH